jgi:hypothetical protein
MNRPGDEVGGRDFLMGRIENERQKNEKMKN